MENKIISSKHFEIFVIHFIKMVYRYNLIQPESFNIKSLIVHN